MKMDIDFIKKIADVMDEKSIVELEMEENGQKLAIKKGTLNSTITTVPVNVATEIASVQEVVTPSAPVSDKKLTPITSPMVGTFYSAPSPDSDPFVTVGDVIKPGQVVCIIEAMKLMNEIEADVCGRVVEICVENGQTIEFGQVLMYVE